MPIGYQGEYSAKRLVFGRVGMTRSFVVQPLFFFFDFSDTSPSQ